MLLRGTMRVSEHGHLQIGCCDTVELARTFGTPLFIIDEALLRENARTYRAAFGDHSQVIYAGKTLLVKAICRIIEEEGLALDVVSGGELHTALSAEFPVSRIYFHGNNKSPAEIRMGLEAGVHRFIVDNLLELERLNRMAADLGRPASVLLRIQPGIEAHTHEYIQTGKIDSKFGFPIATGQALDAIRRALALPNIRLYGIHCHIGSQIFELNAFAEAARIMVDFAAQARQATGWTVLELNLGGGLGIYYVEGDEPPTIGDFARTIRSSVRSAAQAANLPEPCLMVEPGRSLLGPAGTTLYTLGAIKNIPGIRMYAAVDGGMVDNPRPALYQACYEAGLANRITESADTCVSIAGKCCESGDMLIWNVSLPDPKPDDILAVPATGAYTYSMASNYNRLPRPAMVLVQDGISELIVRRESYVDLTRNDIVPARLQQQPVTGVPQTS